MIVGDLYHVLGHEIGDNRKSCGTLAVVPPLASRIRSSNRGWSSSLNQDQTHHSRRSGRLSGRATTHVEVTHAGISSPAFSTLDAGCLTSEFKVLQ